MKDHLIHSIPRRHAPLVLAALGFLCSLCACPTQTRTELPLPTCPSTSIIGLRPVSGDIVFTVDDRTETMDFADPEVPPRCTPILQASFLPDRDGDSDVDAVFWMHFDCYYDDLRRLIIRVRGLPDPRNWQTGSFTHEISGSDIEITFYNTGRIYGVRCDTQNEGAVAQISVEDARGGSRPFPEMVETPYLRAFTFELDLGSVRGEPHRDDRRCPLIGANYRASYLLTDEAYTFIPDAPCP